MTPEEEIAAKFRCRTNVPSAIYNGKNVEYFVENNEDNYDLYFLVTNPNFNKDCDKETLHREFNNMKMYLYNEGFLDSCFKNINREKDWKIHFLVQYNTTPTIKLNLNDDHKKSQSALWALTKTVIVIILIYSLLRWLGF